MDSAVEYSTSLHWMGQSHSPGQNDSVGERQRKFSIRLAKRKKKLNLRKFGISVGGIMSRLGVTMTTRPSLQNPRNHPLIYPSNSYHSVS